MSTLEITIKSDDYLTITNTIIVNGNDSDCRLLYSILEKLPEVTYIKHIEEK